jgi:hypothetical protein
LKLHLTGLSLITPLLILAWLLLLTLDFSLNYR